jgi:ferrous iron transport protein A
MMPLGLLGKGEKAEVIEMKSSRKKEGGADCCPVSHVRDRDNWCGRMENLGLREGRVVEMLNNEGRGAMLIKVDDSRIAIGRGMAMKIMVRRKR